MTNKILTTKAQTLKVLQNKLNFATVPKLYIFNIQSWNTSSNKILSNIDELFQSEVIIRSSTTIEDLNSGSLAGHFKSQKNIRPKNRSDLIIAINNIIDSYNQLKYDEAQEILVQEQITDFNKSGVLFSRDFITNSPYFVINYDEESTSAITSGSSKKPIFIKIIRNIDSNNLENYLKHLINLIIELENITKCKLLDIEFAIKDETVYLFQVRQIANLVLPDDREDQLIFDEILKLKSTIEELNGYKPNLFGSRTILGNMPDWNPAEIIGTTPKPLSYSLYDHIFMQFAWRGGRTKIGYYNPPYSLMISLCGRPYIDVRIDFNSLLPQLLEENVSNNLIDYYINKLSKNPSYHDKVEFKIVKSCYTSGFLLFEAELHSNSFSKDEIAKIKANIIELTNRCINDLEQFDNIFEKHLEKLNSYGQNLVSSFVNSTNIEFKNRILKLLIKLCISYGAIPFSFFVRKAFIGLDILKSLNESGIITKLEYNSILLSFSTVTSDFKDDLGSLRNGLLTKESFLKKYGHLRPGTYDITSLRYDENFDKYFSSIECNTPLN